MAEFLINLGTRDLKKVLKKTSNWFYSMYLKTDQSEDSFIELFDMYFFDLVIRLETVYSVEELKAILE